MELPTQSQAPERSGMRGLMVLLLVWSVWALCYIGHTSFTLDGQRYFCLFDDGMISMRYAQNLAQGHGLVWNAGGERVEGYTNLVWTLIMAAVHGFGATPRLASLFIQLLGLAFLLGNIVCIHRLTLRLPGASGAGALGAAALTAFYQPLNTWGLQGMEVSLLVFLISLSALLLVRRPPEQAPVRLVFSLLALGILTRPDMVVPYLVFLIAVGWYHPRTRWRDLRTGGILLLVTILAVTLFRIGYYGDALPNTYYLKMTGVPLLLRLTRGLFACRDFVVTMGLLLFLLPLIYAVLQWRNRAVGLLAGLLGGQLAYSIYVGGDAWEWYGHYANRYVSVAMPGFFALLVLALGRLVSPVPSVAPAPPVAPFWLRQSAFAVAVAVCWVAVHGALPGWKLTMFLRDMTFQRLPLHVANNAKHTAAGVWLQEACPTNTLLAAHWAGSAPYFAQLPTIDLFGKSDKRIARMETGARTWREVYPGHNKFDYAYALDELKPDVVVTPFPEAIEARGYDVVLDTLDDVRILGRRDSPLAASLQAHAHKASDRYAAQARAWQRAEAPQAAASGTPTP